MSQLLHPANKIRYTEGQQVDVALAGDIETLRKGTIRGLISEHLIDHWIVEFNEPVEGWPYSCISVQHTFLRPSGDNRPFLCEGFSRV
jgi:hypothetical protein